MKIKTRKKKKSNLVEALDNLDQYKVHAKGRPAKQSGYNGRGLYSYDYTTNKLKRVDVDVMRFYQDENTYVELEANKGWVMARSMCAVDVLAGLVIRGRAINCLELKVVHRKFDKDGEDVTWD